MTTTAISELVEQEFACTHEHAVPRRRVVSGGTVTVWRQCLDCGRALHAVKKASLAPGEIDRLDPFDEALPDQFYARRRERWDALRQESLLQHDTAFKAIYDAHMTSPRWRDKRRRVLHRANQICEGCGAARAVHVHHLTYAHLGDEFLFELVALCLACHERVHGHEIGRTP